ncbi:hypothetical protein HK100_000538 [Physocladia obscura]|uniref:BZIP domain-containing protein n=1 Tax=Physocladia obscura TaxID=109957 RepID=A0AAD5SZ60_9FUNG|nr:hypothetical protein HK100_000538 [Physocladia obscura]
MEAKQDSSSSSSDSSKHSRKTQDANTKRAEQMRNAQRSLIARKKAHLADLESANLKLTAENAALKQALGFLSRKSVNEIDCQNPECTAIIETLQHRVLQLRIAFNPVRNNAESLPLQISLKSEGTISPILANAPSACKENLWLHNSAAKSAQDIYGQMDVVPFKIKANRIEPLAGTKILDRIFSLFELISRTSSTNIARIISLKIMRENIRLQQRCGVIDRVKFIDIFSEFHLKYQSHIMHWSWLCIQPCNQPNSKPPIILDPQSAPLPVTLFREKLRAIPGLAPHAFADIDELCGFWMRIAEESTAADEFFQYAFMMHRLLYQCGNCEDVGKFFLAFFSVRQSKHFEMDEVLASIEAEII